MRARARRMSSTERVRATRVAGVATTSGARLPRVRAHVGELVSRNARDDHSAAPAVHTDCSPRHETGGGLRARRTRHEGCTTHRQLSAVSTWSLVSEPHAALSSRARHRGRAGAAPRVSGMRPTWRACLALLIALSLKQEVLADHYSTLGVGRRASDQEIKQVSARCPDTARSRHAQCLAARALMHPHHPARRPIES